MLYGFSQLENKTTGGVRNAKIRIITSNKRDELMRDKQSTLPNRLTHTKSEGKLYRVQSGGAQHYWHMNKKQFSYRQGKMTMTRPTPLILNKPTSTVSPRRTSNGATLRRQHEGSGQEQRRREGQRARRRSRHPHLVVRSLLPETTNQSGAAQSISKQCRMRES
jgi:hypothetical protein